MDISSALRGVGRGRGDRPDVGGGVDSVPECGAERGRGRPPPRTLDWRRVVHRRSQASTRLKVNCRQPDAALGTAISSRARASSCRPSARLRNVASTCAAPRGETPQASSSKVTSRR